MNDLIFLCYLLESTFLSCMIPKIKEQPVQGENLAHA